MVGRCGNVGSQIVKRLLSIATLYPNADNPRFGIFVEKQMEALAARGDWDVTVLNPLGIPPLAWGRYAGVKALCGREERQPHLTVYRFPFTLIPRLGAPFNPAFIIRAALPLAKRLHAEKPFDAVDAQFLYPDAPAAAAIASALNLPLAVKARGADVHFWGQNPTRRKPFCALPDKRKRASRCVMPWRTTLPIWVSSGRVFSPITPGWITACFTP